MARDAFTWLRYNNVVMIRDKIADMNAEGNLTDGSRGVGTHIITVNLPTQDFGPLLTRASSLNVLTACAQNSRLSHSDS